MVGEWITRDLIRERCMNKVRFHMKSQTCIFTPANAAALCSYAPKTDTLCMYRKLSSTTGVPPTGSSPNYMDISDHCVVGDYIYHLWSALVASEDPKRWGRHILSRSTVGVEEEPIDLLDFADPHILTSEPWLYPTYDGRRIYIIDDHEPHVHYYDIETNKLHKTGLMLKRASWVMTRDSRYLLLISHDDWGLHVVDLVTETRVRYNFSGPKSRYYSSLYVCLDGCLAYYSDDLNDNGSRQIVHWSPDDQWSITEAPQDARVYLVYKNNLILGSPNQQSLSLIGCPDPHLEPYVYNDMPSMPMFLCATAQKQPRWLRELVRWVLCLSRRYRSMMPLTFERLVRWIQSAVWYEMQTRLFLEQQAAASYQPGKRKRLE